MNAFLPGYRLYTEHPAPNNVNPEIRIAAKTITIFFMPNPPKNLIVLNSAADAFFLHGMNIHTKNSCHKMQQLLKTAYDQPRFGMSGSGPYLFGPVVPFAKSI